MDLPPPTATVANVARFIEEYGFPDLSQRFVDDEIDGQALYLLEVSDWTAYGVKRGPALKLRDRLKQNTPRKATSTEAENTDSFQQRLVINGSAQDVVHEGPLLKRGPLASYGFKAVWALLTTKGLFVYEDKTRSTLKSSIDVQASTEAKRFTSKTAPGVAVSYARERPFGFVLDVDPMRGKDRILHYFDATELCNLTIWEDAFDRCFIYAKPVKPTRSPCARSSVKPTFSPLARPSRVGRASKIGRGSIAARHSIMATRGTISDFDEHVFHLKEDQLTEEMLNEHPEYGMVTEHAAGSSLAGAEAWSSGRYVVLSGEASILATCGDDGTETTIATLREHNSFGWLMLEDTLEVTADAFTWDSLDARILVSGSQPLRLCHVESPAISDPIQTVGHGRLAELEPLSRQFADLWLHASAPEVGIGFQPSGRLRTIFLTALWGPLVDRLEEHDFEVQRRKKRGYRTHDQFPLEGHQISELRDYILHLTEIWYGSDRGGNLSSFYRWFMKTMEGVGVTAYSMDDIPTELSPDGWANIVDGGTRAKVLKGRGGADASYVATGGLKQKQGRSAIDNTALSNVFTAAEARLLLIGRFMRKALCKFITIRQHCILRRLSKHLAVDLLVHASQAC